MHIHYTQNNLPANPRCGVRNPSINFSTLRRGHVAQVKKKTPPGSACHPSTEADGGSRMGGDLIEISPGRCGFSLHRALQKIDFSASTTSA